ncbi:MAG: hypothetical protein ABI425_00650 [Patescibacteria group bacterium]
MKKYPKYTPFILIGLLILVILVGIGAFAVSKGKGGSEKVTPTPMKKKISKPVNLIPFEERPYVLMSPTLTREVDVTIERLPKAADSVDYLSEYQHGTSLGGNEQFIDLKKGVPATKEFALYSRSAGGKTSYEEDVKGGTLTLEFSGQNEYSLKQDWKYIDNSTKLSTFTMNDDKFSVSGKDLATMRYAILYNSPGAPAPISSKRLSEVYTFQASSPLTGKKADITIQMSEVGKGKIMGWDGKAWITLASTVTDNTVKATQVELLEAYVVTE